MLETEIAYYDKHKEEWVKTRLNQFVLIKGEELIGFYPTIDEALAEGARLYGLDSFLVRRIEADGGEDVYIPALALGLINANPA